jgi:hypothetical protein
MTILLPLRKVIIESPYRATEERSQEVHKAYLLHCLSHSLRRHESPYASHLLIPEILDDDDPMERGLGIRAGWSWAEHADLIAVYSDLGVSEGMRLSIDHYKKMGKTIEWRSLTIKDDGEFDNRLMMSILEM